jgi:hypothetical protein
MSSFLPLQTIGNINIPMMYTFCMHNEIKSIIQMKNAIRNAVIVLLSS